MTLTIVLAFAIMVLIFAGMAVGVSAGRKPITGSCGGMSAVGIDAECEICGGNPARCSAETDLASDASQRGSSTQSR